MRMTKLGTLAAFAALFAACAFLSTKISQIRERPGDYENKVVTIHGKVSNGTKLPFMEEALYEVDDGTGSLTVITPKSLPPDGSTVTATGKVRSALKIGGKSFGLVLLEGKER